MVRASTKEVRVSTKAVRVARVSTRVARASIRVVRVVKIGAIQETEILGAHPIWGITIWEEWEEEEITGTKTLSISRIRAGDQVDSIQCPSGKTNSAATFRLSNFMEAAESATGPAQLTVMASPYHAGLATGRVESVPSASEEESISSTESLAVNAREASGAGVRGTGVPAQAPVTTLSMEDIMEDTEAIMEVIMEDKDSREAT